MVIGYHMHPCELAAHAPQAIAALGGAAQHPVPRIRGARADPDAATPRPCARPPCNGCRPVNNSPKNPALEQRFDALHESLQTRHPQLAAHAIEKSLLPEQVSLPWHPPGLLAGVDEAGRGPLVGPVVAAAVILDDLRPIAGSSKKLTETRREKLFDEIRAKGLVLQHCRGQRGRNRPAQHPASHHAGHAPCGAGPAPEARDGAGRWQPHSRPRYSGRGHRQRRCVGAVHFCGVHLGQGAP